MAETALVLANQPAQFETPAQRPHRGRQAQGQLARFERRFALVQVPERADLRQEQGPAAGEVHERFGEGPRAAPRRQEHHRPAQALAAEGVQQAAGEVVQERAVRRNGKPARRRSLQRTHPRAPSRSRASAASREAGSPTCIQNPPGVTPFRRPSSAACIQTRNREKRSSGTA